MNACLLHSFVCSTRYRLWHAHSSAHHAVANKLIVWLFTSRLSNRLLHGQTICSQAVLFSLSPPLRPLSTHLVRSTFSWPRALTHVRKFILW